MSKLTQSPEWKNLQTHADRLAGASMRPMLKQKRMVSDCGLVLDYTRQLADDAVWDDLFALAMARDLPLWRKNLYGGKAVNVTEKRAAMHMALRAPDDIAVMVDGVDVMPDVIMMKKRLYHFADAVREGRWKGATGKCITTIVNIGIGGSGLGPCMVTRAMTPFHDKELSFYFVSNVDPTDIADTLRLCDPETTLFIIASKTFTTIETLANANTAREWLVSRLGEEAVEHHFVAVSTAQEKVADFGIHPDNMFGFRDWVGGRYSVWSAIGLPLVLAIGSQGFEEFLSGAHKMDLHFLQAPMQQNMPVIMALSGVWNRNFLNIPALAVLPYDAYLSGFPAYVQQLDMESNGKSSDRDGVRVDYETGPIVFGEAGTNGQHTFYQLLHQGTTKVLCDFIVVHETHNPRDGQHDILVANALAQPDALAVGRTMDEAQGNAFRMFEGNRPSHVLSMNELNPATLGALIALYEHKIFVQSVIWNINAFDQFGVELGKEMALKIMASQSGGKSVE